MAQKARKLHSPTADKGIPGGPQYMIEKGKMMKEMGEKMMVEGERMIREADAISTGTIGAPKKK